MSKKKYPEQPILIVDDKEDFFNGIKPRLRKNGITNVEFCQDSREVMDWLRKKKYSIILLDIWMPHINGDVLLKQILHEYPDIPVTMLTADPDTALVVKCVQTGAKNYIVKNFDYTKMIRKIKDVLISSCSEKKIFISYSHQDKDFANRLINDLKNEGMEVWFDNEIKVGESISNEIKREITRCHFFCVILSKHSVKSTWVERECDIALDAREQSSPIKSPGILPVLIHKVKLPPPLIDFRCANFSWNYDKGLSQLLDAIKSINHT